MILNLLISTINERILGLKNIIEDNENIIYTISHQITRELPKEVKIYIDELSSCRNIMYSQIFSIGVAANRNNALKHRVKGAICLLSDDDVIYYKDSFSWIIDTFKSSKSLEFLTFKIKTSSGKDYKNYKPYAFTHTLRSLSIIGIIDVAFREEIIDKYALEFDERFGPGGYYAIGEDFIFMTDAVKQGANIQYIPVDIVQHEDVGTGSILRDDIIIGRGAMFVRVFGLSSFLLNIYFAIKNRRKYKEKYSFFTYLRLLYLGSLKYIWKKK